MEHRCAQQQARLAASLAAHDATRVGRVLCKAVDFSSKDRCFGISCGISEALAAWQACRRACSTSVLRRRLGSPLALLPITPRGLGESYSR